jgi:hypothetical protein
MFAGDVRESIVTLVDSSVWVNHLRRGDDELRALLNAGEVLCHPFIIEELACGSIAKRTEILNLLNALPRSTIAEHDEVMHFLNENRLYGRGLGWIAAPSCLCLAQQSQAWDSRSAVETSG